MRAAALIITLVASSPIAAAQESASDVPVVANRREVAVPLVKALLSERLVPNGTLFVGVRVQDDGRLLVGDTYGVLDRHPVLQRLIRDATSSMRVTASPEWRAATARGEWAVFWMFQDSGCFPRVYSAPERTLPVRVCLDMKDGRLDPDSGRVLFDRADRVSPLSDEPRLRADRRNRLAYPSAALTQSIEGSAKARVSIGEDGKVTTVHITDENPEGTFRRSIESFLRAARFEFPPGADRPDQEMAFEFLVTPCISVPLDAPKSAPDITVCVHRPYR